MRSVFFVQLVDDQKRVDALIKCARTNHRNGSQNEVKQETRNAQNVHGSKS